jgi:hypothetical protein
MGVVRRGFALSLMRVAFKGEIVERDSNDRERCDNLHTVEKFGKVGHVCFVRRSIATRNAIIVSINVVVNCSHACWVI